ncbi:hypothetical protein TUM12151_35090 [Morganella morganii]|nr:hypothetical protein TUM12151_35090 [Morganella morganii]
MSHNSAIIILSIFMNSIPTEAESKSGHPNVVIFFKKIMLILKDMHFLSFLNRYRNINALDKYSKINTAAR